MSKIRGIKHGPGSRISLRQGSPLTWKEASNTTRILVVSRSELQDGAVGSELSQHLGYFSLRLLCHRLDSH